jgi:hypothetical protein
MGYRLKLGDVFSIPTDIGLGFFQATHKNGMMGMPLIRVIDYVAPSPPTDLGELVNKPHRFYTAAMVSQMANQGITTLMGNVPIPDFAQPYPPMIGGGLFTPTGVSKPGQRYEDREFVQQLWQLYENGVVVQRMESLTPEQKKLSSVGIVNDTALKSSIATNWRPEMEPWRNGLTPVDVERMRGEI